MPKTLTICTALLGLSLFAIGCGGDKKEDEKNGKTPAEGHNGKTPAEGHKNGKQKGKKVANGGVTVDHSSPQAVAASFKKAAEQKDWDAMFSSMTDDSHEMLTTGLMFGASMTAFQDQAKQDSLEQLLQKHGIDTSKKKKLTKSPTAGAKDQSALFADLIDWMEKNTPEDKKGQAMTPMAERFATTEFSNFQIQGDQATADVSIGGMKKQRPAEFRLIDGKWYFHLEPRVTKAKGFPKNGIPKPKTKQ